MDGYPEHGSKNRDCENIVDLFILPIYYLSDFGVNHIIYEACIFSSIKYHIKPPPKFVRRIIWSDKYEKYFQDYKILRKT